MAIGINSAVSELLVRCLKRFEQARESTVPNFRPICLGYVA